MNSRQKQPTKYQAAVMKHNKSSLHRKTHAIPNLHFEGQKLTSPSGLIVFQALFNLLSFKCSLRACFKHRAVSTIYSEATLVLLLGIHLLLGYRELRHLQFYQDDPIVKRILGLTTLPEVAAVSRCLPSMGNESTLKVQCMISDRVLTRLKQLSLPRVTLDFDGSALGTGRYAEGAAVGFNKVKKGRRSYNPLYCTVARTGQVFHVLHRS